MPVSYFISPASRGPSPAFLDVLSRTLAASQLMGTASRSRLRHAELAAAKTQILRLNASLLLNAANYISFLPHPGSSRFVSHALSGRQAEHNCAFAT